MNNDIIDAEHLAKAIADEIDFDVILTMLRIADGWIVVHVDIEKTINNNIMEWAQAHCTGRFIGRNSIFAFQHAKDAELFTLRWA